MLTFDQPHDGIGTPRPRTRAIAFVAGVNRLGLDAPAGGVLDACGGLAPSQGRRLLQATLADAVQARVDEAQGKKGPSPPPPAVAPTGAEDGIHDRPRRLRA